MTPRSSPSSVDRLHPRRGQADHVEGAHEVDPDHPLEVLERQRARLADDLARGGDARAADDDAQRTEAGRDVHGRLHLCGVGDIRGHEGGADPVGLCRAVRTRQVDDDDLGSRRAQGGRGGEAEPGCAAGDECDRAADVHQCSLSPRQSRSMIVALAMPAPSHMVCRP